MPEESNLPQRASRLVKGCSGLEFRAFNFKDNTSPIKDHGSGTLGPVLITQLDYLHYKPLNKGLDSSSRVWAGFATKTPTTQKVVVSYSFKITDRDQIYTEHPLYFLQTYSSCYTLETLEPTRNRNWDRGRNYSRNRSWKLGNIEAGIWSYAATYTTETRGDRGFEE